MSEGIINSREIKVSRKTVIAKVSAWPDDEVQVEVLARDGLLTLEQASTLAADILAAVEQSKRLSWIETAPDEYTLHERVQ